MNNVKVTIVNITPELAQKYLQQNKVNRVISPSVYERYARDMKSGNWNFNGDSIRFNDDDELVDGQHRLTAIIKANATVKMMVIRGIKQCGTIDTGHKRTDAANFQIQYNNKDFNAQTQADLSLIASVIANIDKLTVSEFKKLYDFFYEDMMFVKTLPNSKNLGAIIRAAMIVALKKHDIPRETVARFCEIVHDGLIKNDGETQAIIYRNYKISGRADTHSGFARKNGYKQALASLLSFSKETKSKRLAKTEGIDFSYPTAKRILQL